MVSARRASGIRGSFESKIRNVGRCVWECVRGDAAPTCVS